MKIDFKAATALPTLKLTILLAKSASAKKRKKTMMQRARERKLINPDREA
jgi:hypothetical protein